MSHTNRGVRTPIRTISIDTLMESSGVQLGTSGARGLADTPTTGGYNYIVFFSNINQW